MEIEKSRLSYRLTWSADGNRILANSWLENIGLQKQSYNKTLPDTITDSNHDVINARGRKSFSAPQEGSYAFQRSILVGLSLKRHAFCHDDVMQRYSRYQPCLRLDTRSRSSDSRRSVSHASIRHRKHVNVTWKPLLLQYKTQMSHSAELSKNTTATRFQTISTPKPISNHRWAKTKTNLNPDQLRKQSSDSEVTKTFCDPITDKQMRKNGSMMLPWKGYAAVRPRRVVSRLRGKPLSAGSAQLRQCLTI